VVKGTLSEQATNRDKSGPFGHIPFPTLAQARMPACEFFMLVLSVSNRVRHFSCFQVHKLVDLSDAPNREAIWFLEVMEADKKRNELGAG
jgi:hypothetical protein